MNGLAEELKRAWRPIRVLLVDDHSVVRLGLRTLFSVDRRVTVVGEAANGASALDQVRSLNPDVVLLDLRLPDQSGIEVCRKIRAEDLPVRVLVMTSYADDHLILEAMKAGVDGYLLKDADDADLAGLIVQVALGAVILDPKVARTTLAKPSAKENRATPANATGERLSPQERRLLVLLADGLSNKELSDRLGLGEGTIRNYLSSVYSKLGIRSRSEAVGWWLRNGETRARQENWGAGGDGATSMDRT